MAREMEGTVYLDRMLISSLSISYAWNYGSFNAFLDDVIEYIDRTGHVFLGDCTVLLDAEMSSIQRRNQLRPRLLGERWVGAEVIRKQKVFYRVYAEAAESENWHVITTDGMTSDEFNEAAVAYSKKIHFARSNCGKILLHHFYTNRLLWR